MRHTKTYPPPISWWVNTTKSLSRNKLLENPDALNKLGIHADQFINWHSKRYCGLFPDFDTEIEEFIVYINNLKRNGVNNNIRHKIFERDKHTCLYCLQNSPNLELDHMIPLSRGGDHNEHNLATSCRTCNRKKRNKTTSEFLIWRVSHA